MTMKIHEAKQILRAYCMTTDCSQCSFYQNNECNSRNMIQPCLWKDGDEYERIEEARLVIKTYCLFNANCKECSATAREDCEQDNIEVGQMNAFPVKIPAAWSLDETEGFQDDDEENEP